MPDQDHVVQVLPFDHVDDVGDVGVERDLPAHQVHALAEPGQRRREHLVAAAFQQIGDAAPAPAAVP
jgi:hypothetical protein